MTNRRDDAIILLGQADTRMREVINLVWRALDTQEDMMNGVPEIHRQCENMLMRCMRGFKEDLQSIRMRRESE